MSVSIVKLGNGHYAIQRQRWYGREWLYRVMDDWRNSLDAADSYITFQTEEGAMARWNQYKANLAKNERDRAEPQVVRELS